MDKDRQINQIRAIYDQETVVVYQAYPREIAEPAIKRKKFISPPFNMHRMTWIKPSFFWMMYRSGWATKKEQEFILSIRVLRSGFEWAMRHSCLSHFEPRTHQTYENWKKTKEVSPVRIQWDPERDFQLNPLRYQRAIQIGLSGFAVEKYVHDWIVDIQDITPACKKIQQYLLENKAQQAFGLIPKESPYPISNDIQLIINATA